MNLGFELWKIDERIMECVDEETGEILQEELMDKLVADKENLVEEAALLVKNLNAELEAVKAEKMKFYGRQQQIENKITTVKDTLTNVLQGEKFKTAKVSISYRKTQSVNVTDLDAIPDEYKRIKIEADKTAIKNAMKNDGEVFDGAELVYNTSIQIK